MGLFSNKKEFPPKARKGYMWQSKNHGSSSGLYSESRSWKKKGYGAYVRKVSDGEGGFWYILYRSNKQIKSVGKSARKSKKKSWFGW